MTLSSVTIKQIPDELLLLDDATGPVRRLLLLAAVGVAVDDGWLVVDEGTTEEDEDPNTTTRLDWVVRGWADEDSDALGGLHTEMLPRRALTLDPDYE